jgi:uncharacterized protein
MKDKQQIDQWLSKLLCELISNFGAKLLLVVHVGSWARNDANAQSDIDVNVILDSVNLEDIEKYRAIIRSMPDSLMACGYLGGLNEIKMWPRFDMISFFYGSQVLFGNLSEVIGSISRKDIFENALVSTSMINHAVRHALIYDDINPDYVETMHGLYKTAFFVLQGLFLLEHEEFIAQKMTLLEKSDSNEDKYILSNYLHWDVNKRMREENPIETLKMLERWSSSMFERLSTINI